MHIIVARARNGVIGNHGTLPWHLPEDLAHFRRTTMGHSIIMGRRTWDSIGRALPGRHSIVVTRNRHWRADGAQSAASLEEAIALGANHGAAGPERVPEVFVVGGAQLYSQALAAHVDALLVTEIDADFDGDTVFPAIEPARWRQSAREHFAPSANRPFAFDFVRYEAVPSQDPQLFSGDPNAQ